jgi:alginate O-acetyltransferase complex protein AlgI
MLFNSFEFIFAFLPLTLAVYFLLGHFKLYRWCMGWLVVASLFFYSWWDWHYLWLLAVSIAFNYTVGEAIGRSFKTEGAKWRGPLLWFGVLMNLAFLGYFKYANFFVLNMETLSGRDFNWVEVILPIGISFYTFGQTAYLVDAYRGQTTEYGFLEYCLFVLFFPHLIAGPILYHREMLPQFKRESTYSPHVKHLMIGVTLFAIGLFKKVVIADNVAPFSTDVFAAAAAGKDIGMLPAWLAALAFTVQVYFDFSGYSDMAVGLARMFGIQLPFNFFSPLRSRSIIDFWRRWHMTLTRFITGYVFNGMAVPLMRFSFRRQLTGFADMAVTVLLPTFVTFVLVGLWHGAGWNYILFGALHGFYIVVNYVWRQLRRGKKLTSAASTMFADIGSRVLFMVALVASMILFRSQNWTSIVELYSSMIDLSSLSFSSKQPLFYGWREIAIIGVPLLIALAAPNSQQIMGLYRPGIDIYKWQRNRGPARWWQWRMAPAYAVLTAVILSAAILALTTGNSEFLYFEF